LDLGLHVLWSSDLLHTQLATLREQAAGTDGIQPPDCQYLVLPSGKPPMYRYHLQFPEGQIYLTASHELKNHPNVYVSISAKTLWTLGAAGAVEVFKQHIEAMGGVIESIVPSRVDLAADLIIPGGLSFEFLHKHLVTCARTLRPFFKDDKLQTLYIGEGDLQVRIYNKWAETIASGKTFFIDVWNKAAGKNLGEDLQHVWRVEGQLRRPVLKELRIDSLEALYDNLGGLWKFITEWASLRLCDNENTTRRSLHPLWALVQSATGILGDPGLALRRIHSDASAPVAWYVAHIAGCLVGFASRLNVAGLAEALRMLQVHLYHHLTPQAFAARVQAELIRLGVTAATAPQLPPPT